MKIYCENDLHELMPNHLIHKAVTGLDNQYDQFKSFCLSNDLSLNRKSSVELFIKQLQTEYDYFHTNDDPYPDFFTD